MKKLSLIVTAFLLAACSSETSSTKPETTHVETITDDKTQLDIETIVPPEDSIVIEWGADNMDRGQYDYYWRGKKIVVATNYSQINRGDVIYFQTPEFEYEFDLQEKNISRVVGLHGETIEIKNGQVFIDNKKLDTFYSKALNKGLGEEEYFEKVNPANRVNDEWWKEYFATDMKPVKITENTVFVLGDNWWRSVDSRAFGPLSKDIIEGKVLGYEK